MRIDRAMARDSSMSGDVSLVASTPAWAFCACSQPPPATGLDAQFVKKALADRRQAVAIGMAASGKMAEGHRIVGCPVQLPAGENTRGVAMDHNRQQGRRIVRFRSSARIPARPVRQVQLIDRLDDESRQVILVHSQSSSDGGGR